MKGYIKIYRKIMENAVIQDAELFRLFMVILLNVAFDEGSVLFNKQVVHVKAGELVTSQSHLQNVLGISREILRNKLKILCELGAISIQQTTNKYSMISVINWDSYQSSSTDKQPANNQQTTNKQPANNQPLPYKEECKECKENKTARACAWEARARTDCGEGSGTETTESPESEIMRRWVAAHPNRTPSRTYPGLVDAKISKIRPEPYMSLEILKKTGYGGIK